MCWGYVSFIRRCGCWVGRLGVCGACRRRSRGGGAGGDGATRGVYRRGVRAATASARCCGVVVHSLEVLLALVICVSRGRLLAQPNQRWTAKKNQTIPHSYNTNKKKTCVVGFVVEEIPQRFFSVSFVSLGFCAPFLSGSREWVMGCRSFFCFLQPLVKGDFFFLPVWAVGRDSPRMLKSDWLIFFDIRGWSSEF